MAMERVKSDQKLDQKLSTDGLWIQYAVILSGTPGYSPRLPPLSFPLALGHDM